MIMINSITFDITRKITMMAHSLIKSNKIHMIVTAHLLRTRCSHSMKMIKIVVVKIANKMIIRKITNEVEVLAIEEVARNNQNWVRIDLKK